MGQIHTWFRALHEETQLLEALARVLAESEFSPEEYPTHFYELVQCIRDRGSRLLVTCNILREFLKEYQDNQE